MHLGKAQTEKDVRRGIRTEDRGHAPSRQASAYCAPAVWTLYTCFFVDRRRHSFFVGLFMVANVS